MRVLRLFFIGQGVTLKALTLPWEGFLHFAGVVHPGWEGFLHFAGVVHPGYRRWRPEWDGPPQQAWLCYDPTRSISLNLHVADQGPQWSLGFQSAWFEQSLVSAEPWQL